MSFLDGSARELINAYNCGRSGPRYNHIAAEVYKARALADPLSPTFEGAILDGLMGFGMGITIKGGRSALGLRLERSLEAVRQRTALAQLGDCRLSSADLEAIKPIISSAYDCLALSGTLHPVKASHVGATKTLHWLFPDLFLIVDSNVAKAFRKHSGVGFRRSTQPGYCAEKYFTCLREAQKEIQSFRVDQFRQLDPLAPEARIFDKIAFVLGQRANSA
jgi:hypothetical protein